MRLKLSILISLTLFLFGLYLGYNLKKVNIRIIDMTKQEIVDLKGNVNNEIILKEIIPKGIIYEFSSTGLLK